MEKFKKDFTANEELGTKLKDALIAEGYKMGDVKYIPTHILKESVHIRLDTTERNKVRKFVIGFLNRLGYVKKVSGSSGATFLNTEDNSKRVYYGIDTCKYRAECIDELQDYVSIFLIFETR